MLFSLKAIADESRWRILEILLKQDLCVGALARRVGLSEAAISQHLQVLRKAGLVKGEKRGYWTHYSVDRENLRQLARKVEALAELSGCTEKGCFRVFSQEGIQEGRMLESMCCTDCCQRPEKLKGKPKECTTEQIKECHGESKEHLCEFPMAGKKTETGITSEE